MIYFFMLLNLLMRTLFNPAVNKHSSNFNYISYVLMNTSFDWSRLIFRPSPRWETCSWGFLALLYLSSCSYSGGGDVRNSWCSSFLRHSTFNGYTLRFPWYGNEILRNWSDFREGENDLAIHFTLKSYVRILAVVA